jgi:hypothetical protein
MNIDDKVSLYYFGKKVKGIIKNIFDNTEITLLLIQVTPHAALWLPPSVIIANA